MWYVNGIHMSRSGSTVSGANTPYVRRDGPINDEMTMSMKLRKCFNSEDLAVGCKQSILLSIEQVPECLLLVIVTVKAKR